MATETDAGVQLIEAARSLAPRIRELAPQIEKDGQLPAELVDTMRSAGFFHLMLSPEVGGCDVDPVTAARVVEEVAAADGSAGWCLMIAAQTAGFAGLLSPEQARTVYGNGGIVAGVANPIGRAIPASSPEEGYVATGRWPFASGSSHANWFAGECTVYDGDQPAKDENGNEVLRLAFVSRDQVTVHQTWNTTGLRGTASNDFSIDGVFVPAARAVSMDFAGQDAPILRAMPLLFINHGGHALGVARGAIESATAIAKKKRGWGGVPLQDTARLQAALAEATVLVESAAEHLYGAAGRLWQQAMAGGTDAG
ncbi:MAG TPA: acyl-CoA dehydrogenase family protein, partial [Dehalococcoidia bacterium]|nr:acyl-CoA dehydrogenase family protein [Dehalococcoidia bacterium]